MKSTENRYNTGLVSLHWDDLLGSRKKAGDDDLQKRIKRVKKLLHITCAYLRRNVQMRSVFQWIEMAIKCMRILDQPKQLSRLYRYSRDATCLTVMKRRAAEGSIKGDNSAASAKLFLPKQDSIPKFNSTAQLDAYEQEDAIIMDKQEENQGDHQPKRRARARRPRNRSISSLE
eukprot:scaffold12866_cov100-Skeletonema_dohrnii-CCMP3373.AAC.1